MAKVALLLANGFETIEALTTVDVLRRAKVQCDTFGVDGEDVISSHNITVKADKRFDFEEIKDYDFLVLPGGLKGAETLRDTKEVIDLIKVFNEKNKYIAAICAAPIALGRAGITEGLEMVCYPGMEENLVGAIIKNEGVVSCNNIITAKGAAYSADFAFEILAKISKEKSKEIKKLMLF